MKFDISQLTDDAILLVKKGDLHFFATKLAEQIKSSQPESSTLPEIVDIKGASEITGYARQTIYQKVSNNEIPFIKRGRKLWFERSVLIAWIQEGRTEVQSDNEVEEYLRRKQKGGQND